MVQDIGHFGLCCMSTRNECTVVNGMSYKCQIDPVGIAKFCCILLDFLFILTVTVEEVLKSPMVFLRISPFCSISFWFSYLEFYCLVHTCLGLLCLLIFYSYIMLLSAPW